MSHPVPPGSIWSLAVYQYFKFRAYSYLSVTPYTKQFVGKLLPLLNKVAKYLILINYLRTVVRKVFEVLEHRACQTN